jgi:hypothetical protein
MRVRSVDVSVLEEPRNSLSNRHSSFHVIYSPLMVVLCWLIKVKLTSTGFPQGPVGATKDLEVLNGALRMTQNLAEQVG